MSNIKDIKGHKSNVTMANHNDELESVLTNDDEAWEEEDDIMKDEEEDDESGDESEDY